MVSLLIIFLVLASTFFFGIPFILLTNAIKDDNKYFLLAPFLGIAIIVLFLQNLVYMDITLRHSTWILWSAGVILWITTALLKKIIWPTKQTLFVLIIAFSALTISGWGYIYSDYNECYGECWIDQYNYVAKSQYLVDNKFHTSFSNIDNKPFQIRGILNKEFHIGEDMLLGFFATTALTDTNIFFGAIILLMPFLLTLSMYLLSNHFFEHKIALFTALLTAIFPILTKLHIENFLSQALFIPLFFVIPWLFLSIINKRKFYDLLLLSFIIATAFSIYYEFNFAMVGVIFLGVVGILLNYKQYMKGHSLKLSLYLILLPLLIFILNPYFSWKWITILVGTNFLTEGLLANIYTFAFDRTMIPIIFWGDVIPKNISNILGAWWGVISIIGLNIGAFLLFFVAIIGWGHRFLKDSFKNILLIICIGILLAPLIFFAHPKNYPYLFFKLYMVVSPLLILGLIIGLKEIGESINLKNKFFSISCTLIFIGFVMADISLIFPTVNSDSIVMYASKDASYNNLKNLKFTAARESLSSLKNKNVVIDSSNHIINAWLSYFAKNNNVWLLNDQYGDIVLFNDVGNRGMNFVDLDQVPEDALIYTYYDNSLVPFDKTEALKIRQKKGYFMGPH